jgi:hypothetical protein
VDSPKAEMTRIVNGLSHASMPQPLPIAPDTPMPTVATLILTKSKSIKTRARGAVALIEICCPSHAHSYVCWQHHTMPKEKRAKAHTEEAKGPRAKRPSKLSLKTFAEMYPIAIERESVDKIKKVVSVPAYEAWLRYSTAADYNHLPKVVRSFSTPLAVS